MTVAGIEEQWIKCMQLGIIGAVSLVSQMCTIMNCRNIRVVLVPASAMISPLMFAPSGEFPFTLGPNVVLNCSASTTVYDTLAKP